VSEQTSTGLMSRKEALEDLVRRAGKGKSVINHHRDDEPFLCAAYSLISGLKASDQRFGYYVQDGRAHVITGQPTQMDIEGKFRQLQVQRNGDDLRHILSQPKPA